VAGAAGLQTWLASRQLGRYVAYVHRLVPDTQSLFLSDKEASQRIELVTYDLFGRQRSRTFLPGMLEAESRGAWLPISTGASINGLGMAQGRPYLLFHGHGKETEEFRQLAATIEDSRHV